MYIIFLCLSPDFASPNISFTFSLEVEGYYIYYCTVLQMYSKPVAETYQ